MLIFGQSVTMIHSGAVLRDSRETDNSKKGAQTNSHYDRKDKNDVASTILDGGPKVEIGSLLFVS